MPATKPDWTINKDIAVGRGATFQQWVATVDKEMDVAPWGEGHLRVNGLEIGSIDNAKDRRQVFRDLNKVAERYLQGQIPVVKAKLLDGKKGLVVGIANVDSIAWGMCESVSSVRSRARCYLSQRQSQEIC